MTRAVLLGRDPGTRRCRCCPTDDDRDRYAAGLELEQELQLAGVADARRSAARVVDAVVGEGDREDALHLRSTLPVRFAVSGIVTVFVVPCSVSLPVAEYFFVTPSFGTGARSIGLRELEGRGGELGRCP